MYLDWCLSAAFKVKLHHDNYDVIHYQWLLDSIAAHKEVPLWAKKCVLCVFLGLQLIMVDNG